MNPAFDHNCIICHRELLFPCANEVEEARQHVHEEEDDKDRKAH